MSEIVFGLARIVAGIVIGFAIARFVITTWPKLKAWRAKRLQSNHAFVAAPLPTVECIVCKHVANCARMKDGTVYKPIAWYYPNQANPMQGVCGRCRGNRYDGLVQP